ncbi:MAG: phosphoglucosamine mutase [Candidatus Marinimicrobia bacterium]|nr:phosphoglucosamine mutase [Candidatus Neomarinimicrobiota bacterium]|tara:strand:+ start:7893 stop:9230 length:1338 start_codon:yes stop_codon:yes gene_type:complete
MLIESISGVRGTVGDGLTKETIRDYVDAFHLFSPDGQIVIGRDSRPSGSEFASEIINRLKELGRSVKDCGIIPTPTVQFTVESSDEIGGIVITASHNPSEWNGLKFVGGDGCFLNGDEVKALMALKGTNPEISQLSGERIEDKDAVNRHIAKICDVSWIDLNAIKNRCFRVAVDAVNGATAEALPMFLSAFGCEVITINCETSGAFVRGTEPLPKNLAELASVVKEKMCDVGLASDPDGDRLAIIDETGKPIGEEYTLVLALDSFLQSGKSSAPVVTNLSTTLAMERVAARHSIQVLRSAVGEINVVEMMKENGSLIGGEGNGGVILKEVHLGRDSLVAAAALLQRLSLTDETLSGVMSQLPRFEIVKDKVSVEGIEANVLFEKIAESFDDASRDERDGLKLSWNNRWVHIRASNTEPILRIYAEATTADEARRIAQKVKAIVKE